MDSQTKSELIETLMGTATAIGKEMLVRRQDEKRLEKQAEIEKEIAEARERATAGARESADVGQTQQVGRETPGSAQTPQDDVEESETPREREQRTTARDRSSTPDGTVADFDALAEEEDCEMCKAILAHIRDLGPEKRARGLADYGRMKRAMEDEGTEEAVRAVVNDSPVLEEAMQAAV